MKTISADDLLKEIDDFLEILGLERNGHYACGYLDGVLKIKNMIKRQSAVEAEIVVCQCAYDLRLHHEEHANSQRIRERPLHRRSVHNWKCESRSIRLLLLAEESALS